MERTPLSVLISKDLLPEPFGFFNEALDTLLDDIYFNDLTIQEDYRGQNLSYQLKVLADKKLALSMPGVGVALVLNPGYNSTAPSEFPVSVIVHKGILKYIKDFKITGFGGLAQEFIDLAERLFVMEDVTLYNFALEAFVTASDPVAQFATDVDAQFSVSCPYSGALSAAENLENIAVYLRDTELLASWEVVLGTYILQGSPSGYLDNLNALLSVVIYGSVEGGTAKVQPSELILQAMIPWINAEISLLPAIEFDRKLLVPIRANGELETDTNILTTIELPQVDLFFDSRGQFGINTTMSCTFPASHPTAQIGNTGFSIGFTNAKLDFSREKNIPEADADGRPSDFVGVYVEEATIGLPDQWFQDDPSNPNPATVALKGRNLLIGTGGLSGTIGLETTGPGLFKKIGGFQVSLNQIDVTFHQGAITSSTIKGKLKIEKFLDDNGNPVEIKIDVHIGNDGDFSVTASTDQDISFIEIENILTVHLKSVALGRKDGRFYLAVSGDVDFTFTDSSIVNKLLPDKIEVQKLLIWDNGDIEFEGGKIVLPKALSLKIGPVELSVSALGMGSHEQERGGVLRKYKYVTFDGGVSVDPGGVDVSGSGIAIYFTVDNDLYGGWSSHHVFVRIQSIAIDLVIPGDASPENALLLLKGFLSMKNPENGGEGTEYAGGVEFTLPKLKMGGSAAMRLNPKVPAFLVDVSLEIATPILLGSTGLGIYGFRGLVGQRYVATKQAAGLSDSDPWWKYYKAKVPSTYKEGITVDKFSQEDGFSLGAGVSLATAPDGGRTFSSKLFFLLSLPEVFLLQGQGQILKERIGLDTTQDPPFFALLAISSTSIEAAFGVNYKIPDDGAEPGAIATVDALIEMGFFWGNSAGWYLNIGKDQPTNERIQVRLLKIVNAYFYMMLSSSGIRAGAGASYELRKKFGPLKAELYAYLDVAGKISFKPKQIGGSIALGGGVGLSIFGFGFHISVAASLAAEAPKPFNISGSLKVCIRVLRKDRCAKFEFSWSFRNQLDDSEILLQHADPAKSVKALNMHTEEGMDLYVIRNGMMPTPSQVSSYIIPADSYIDIEFVKGVLPSSQVIAKFGGNSMGAKYIDYVAPQRGKSDRVRHEYVLDRVRIMYANSANAWVDYDPYAAATPQSLLPFLSPPGVLGTLPYGYWQFQTPNLYNKLRVMATSPLAYASQGSGDLVLEDLNITGEDIFCDPELLPMECFDFVGYNPGYGQTPWGWNRIPDGQLFFHGHALMRIDGGEGEVAYRPYSGIDQALRIPANSHWQATFSEAKAVVSLLIHASCVDVVVRFFRRVMVNESGVGDQPEFAYELVRQRRVLAGLTQEVTYNDLQDPVSHVEIEVSSCKEPRILSRYGEEEEEVNSKVEAQERVNGEKGGRKGLLQEDVKGGGRFIPVGEEPIEIGPEIGPGPLDPKDNPCGDLTPQASQLEVYLNVLVRSGHLVGQQQVYYTDHMSQYVGSFFDTPLYPGIPPEKTWVLHTVTYEKEERIEWTVTSSTGYSCTFSLEIVPPPNGVNWYLVSGFTNLRPDLSNPQGGANYDFLVDAYYNGYLITFRGTSCYPIVICEETELCKQCIPSPLVEVMAKFMDSLFANGRVGEGKFNIFPYDGGVFDGLYYNTPLYPNPDGKNPIDYIRVHMDRVWLAFDIRDARGYRCRFNLYDTNGVGINWERVIKIVDLVPDFSGGGLGPVYGFRAIAIMDTGQPIEIHGNSCHLMGWCREDCAAYLYQVCSQGYEEAAYNANLATLPPVANQIATLINGFNGTIQPVWRPNTRFLIEVQGYDNLYRENQSSPFVNYSQKLYIGFRTAGPPGHYHIYKDGSSIVKRSDYQALENEDREDEFKLSGLKHYVDYPKSYPNADGQLLNSKPLFYKAPRLGLYFIKDYVYEFYNDWNTLGGLPAVESKLEAVIKDPAPDPNAPVLPNTLGSWEINNRPIVSTDVLILNNMINNTQPGDCAPSATIQPQALYPVFELPDLLPLKLYTAIFNAKFGTTGDSWGEREVHRYGFQTSRYADFEEQVQSWILYTNSSSVVEKTAVYVVELDNGVDFTLAANVLHPTDTALAKNDPLRQEFGDKFNRLIEGVLKMSALHPASTTEFNVIREAGSGRTLGILVKNPEPFNDPKTPLGSVTQPIRLTVNGDASYHALFSKDLSQCFLYKSDRSLNLPAGAALSFAFDYVRYDGITYTVEDTQSVSFTLPS